MAMHTLIHDLLENLAARAKLASLKHFVSRLWAKQRANYYGGHVSGKKYDTQMLQKRQPSLKATWKACSF
ncbi:Hypothetical predicted protein [Podarcis lilfordi]|uniref:Uncharacterized protein n=1 Tax=Podarcis lilfordi TaxID=74358 RepID=A0AA35L4B0_9SAUR|nr:Hypothetical predicted protein [Podarcis lilfordi]